MLDRSNIDQIGGATAYGSDGEKIGAVDQVYVDDHTGEPSWITVNTGMFGSAASFVPLEGARMEQDAVVLPHDKDRVKDAPRMDTDQHLSPEEEARLFQHYGVTDTSSAQTTDPSLDHAQAGLDEQDTGTGRETSDTSVTRSEERLNVGTEEREAGRVRLRKYVTSETQNVEVPVTQEKVRVERTPVEGTSSGTIDADTDQVEDVVLREERPVVDKETVDVERIDVSKETVTDEQTVSGEVRKEQVEVEGDDTAR